MSKILVVVGSHKRKGNTDLLADAFIDGAIAAGNTTHKVFLGEKNVNGCWGCNACRYGKPCVQKDDMQNIYPLIEQSDTIVLASPLYYWTISAQLKAFIERFYALSMEDKSPPLGRYEKYPHKNCVLLLTAADNFFWTFEQAVSYYNFALINYLGWHNQGMVLAGGCGGVDSERQIQETIFLQEAYLLGSKV